MNKLSVVIITYNEERNIKRCLDSVKSIADEIIVVDSFSTDKTKDICTEEGVKFIQLEWLGYSEQKNYANILVVNDWILSIDASEISKSGFNATSTRFKLCKYSVRIKKKLSISCSC